MSPIRRVTTTTFRSLRVRNYRLYFWGQLISLVGTWMQQLGQAWLVLRITGNSGVALGITTALQFVPTLVLGMLGGVLADRFDKRRILIATQSAAGALGLVLGVLTATGSVRLWMVYALAAALGLVQVADVPARQAFVTEMVGPEEIPNAVALNSAVFNAGRIVGPTIAGALIYSTGIASTFIVNGLSYFAVVAALMMMNRAALHTESLVPRARGQVREGLRYIRRSAELRETLLLVAIVATFGFNFSVTLPLLAKITFGGGAGTFSVLMAVMSAGALLGSLGSAARKRPTRTFLAGAGALFGALALTVAAAPSLPAAAALLAPMGAASMAFIATANSLLQTRSAPFMRGRVMALYSMVFLGGTAIGGPLSGWVSETLGARWGIALGAALSLAAAIAASAGVLRRRRRAAAAAVELADLDAGGALAGLEEAASGLASPA